ncbi:MAG: NRDE family protein [Chitinophagaceae bacterium]
MCTVSFIPIKSGLILTSNRDEHISRGIAQYPEFYMLNGRKLAFPKDEKSGGTWFISNEKGDTGVLLNGAFEKHRPVPPYRKSRGLVLPELFQQASPFEAMTQYDFSGIENFTIILWEEEQLSEIKWDGKKLTAKKQNPRQAHIWSSVTLYDNDMIKKRHGWFSNWEISQTHIVQQNILDFHSNTQAENKEFGLRISRNNKISTTSITSLCIQHQKAHFYHKDYIQHIESTLYYDLLNVPPISSPVIATNETDQKN